MLPWQDIIAIALVGLCAGYLTWQGWRFMVRRKAGGCATGGCETCPAAAAKNAVNGKPIVQISDPRERK